MVYSQRGLIRFYHSAASSLTATMFQLQRNQRPSSRNLNIDIFKTSSMSCVSPPVMSN